MQGGGYVDDLAVFPAFQGQGVGRALLAAAGAVEARTQRGASLSLDVRAANVPAINLYRALGFQFSELMHPSFLDWDGGYEGMVDAAEVAAKCPLNADITAC